MNHQINNQQPLTQPTSQLKAAPPVDLTLSQGKSLAQNLQIGGTGMVTKQVDVLIIGGGPAALGLNELLQGDGLAILDSGLNFGGGLLSKYGINSNTSGGGFLKCTFKKNQAKDKQGVTENNTNTKDTANKYNQKRKENTYNGNKNNWHRKGKTNSEVATQNPYAQAQSNIQKCSNGGKKEEVEILPPYRDLYASNIVKVLKEFGKNTAPLAVIGHFLNYAGNHLLSYIYQTTRKRIFHPLHKAVSVQLMNNGEIMTKVIKKQVEVNEQGQIVRFIETDHVICFRSKVLVIANGGVQGLHPNLFDWFPNLSPEKAIASDSFLRSDVYIQTMQRIKEQNLKKIVIIGGSHSGFSSAWMLLNGPAAYYKNNAGIVIENEPYAQRKQIKNCLDCCHCGVQLQNLKKTKLNDKMQQSIKEQLTQVQASQANCNCQCWCFGVFNYEDWKFDYQNLLPQYEDHAIEILYRDHIRVFYNKVTDAEMDGYTEFEEEKFSRKDGYLYSFTGLRGDAKELYLKIMRGQEKRVRLIQAKTAEEQREYVERADLVIWACGYQTNSIIIKDTDRKKIALSQKVPNTQYDVDGKCRVMLADGHSLTKVFACGIGYPVRTKDGMVVTNPNQSNPRADSFSLYMNFVGDMILKGILPKQKWFKNTVHKALPQKNYDSYGNKNNYQQVLKGRIQQYKASAKLIEQGNNGVRHKSLNIREQYQNTLRKSQLTFDQGKTVQNNLQSQEFKITDQISNAKQQQVGSKSVDRTIHKNGAIQNKLAKMAKSPQILQKKQQIIKQKNPHLQQQLFEVAERMNSDLMHLVNKNKGYKQQTYANQVRTKNEELKKIKSPYNNGSNKFSNKLNKKDQFHMSTNSSSKHQRILTRSSQATRRQDYLKQTDPPFKMGRSQHATFGNNKQQRNNRDNINLKNQVVFNNQLYNSMAVGAFDKQYAKQNGIELPPIHYQLNQNHYADYQQTMPKQDSQQYFLNEQEECYFNKHHETVEDDIQRLDTDLQQVNIRQLSYTQQEYQQLQNQNLQSQHNNENYDYTISPRYTVETFMNNNDDQIQMLNQNYSEKKVTYGDVVYVENDVSISDKSQEDFERDDAFDINQRLESQQMIDEQQYQSDGISSNYGDDLFENEDDPLREDVSSEGSCINTNSYIRSNFDRIDMQEDVHMMDDYNDQQNNEEDGNVEIPDEENEKSPRKIVSVIPSIENSHNAKILGVSTKRSQIIAESQPSHNIEDSQKQPIEVFQNNKESQANLKQQKQQSMQYSYKMSGVPEVRKINKKQISPVLLSKNSSNNLSNQKKSVRESHDYIAKSVKQNQSTPSAMSMKKRKYLNGNVTINQDESQSLDQHTYQSRGKSIKQAMNSQSTFESKEKSANFIKRNYLNPNQKNTSTNEVVARLNVTQLKPQHTLGSANKQKGICYNALNKTEEKSYSGARTPVMKTNGFTYKMQMYNPQKFVINK